MGNKASLLSRGEVEMETFAAKVHKGDGLRFDPLLEEKGGWISREAPCHKHGHDLCSD